MMNATVHSTNDTGTSSHSEEMTDTSASMAQETRSSEGTVAAEHVDENKSNDDLDSPCAVVTVSSKSSIFAEREVNTCITGSVNKVVEKRPREVDCDHTAASPSSAERKAKKSTTLLLKATSSNIATTSITKDDMGTVSTHTTCTRSIAASIDRAVPPSTQTEEEPTNDDENRGVVKIRTTKKSRISEEDHNDDDDDSEPTLYKAEGYKDDTTRTATTKIDGTSNTTVAEQDPITQMSKIEKSFAPSIEAYLNQGRQTISDESTTTSSPTELKYLPRPEWCKPPHFFVGDTLCDTINPWSFSLNDAVTMHVDDYMTHLKQVVTNQHLGHHEYDDECNDHNINSEWLSVSYDSDDDGDDDEKDAKTTALDSQNHSGDVHTSSHEDDTTIQQKIDFLENLIDSYTIYFDVDNHLWKTTRTKKSPNSTICGDTNNMVNDGNESEESTSLFEHTSKFQITYKELIQRLYFMKLDGLDRNTLLLQAIEKNATDVAMDIIRIEHNTREEYLRCDPTEGIESYASIRTFTSLETPNKVGVTPLIMAIQKGNMLIVQALLSCRISIFYASSKQYTSSALFQTAHFGRKEMMEHLIEHYHKNCHDECTLDSFIDFKNKNGTTPLMRAAQEGHLSAVQLLLKNEADCNMQNKIGMSPLMLAAQRGYTEICQLLIRNGADIDATTDQDVNALLLACKRGHVAVVKALVTAGCDLLHTNNQELSIQQFIQRRIQKRNVRSVEIHIPRNFLLRRNLFEIQSGDDCDGRMNDDAHDDDNMFEISNSTDTKLLFLLHPHTQFQLIQRSSRVQRNFEIRLLQEERAGIDFQDGSTSDIFSAVQRLTQLLHDHNGGYIAMTMSTIDKRPPLPRQKAKQIGLPSIFTKRCSQTLLRTMLLPAPLVKMIALFLPLPNLWSVREDGLRSYESPNETIFHALDFIDEILEEGGILLAFDKAQVPPPSPHRTWCDWKRSSRPNGTWSDLDDEEKWPLLYQNPFHLRRSSITTSSLPSFRDKSNPTICELRRSVGYSAVLSQNKSLTNIASILEDAPYHMPRYIIDQLILIHDVASICRRCCMVPYRSTLMQNEIQPSVNFDVSTKYDIIALVRSLRSWYDIQTELNNEFIG